MDIKSGTRVKYHGSIAKVHGPAVYIGRCNCPQACGGHELELLDGRPLDHVRITSFTECSDVR